jgi:hypothetical protein
MLNLQSLITTPRESPHNARVPKIEDTIRTIGEDGKLYRLLEEKDHAKYKLSTDAQIRDDEYTTREIKEIYSPSKSKYNRGIALNAPQFGTASRSKKIEAKAWENELKSSQCIDIDIDIDGNNNIKSLDRKSLDRREIQSQLLENTINNNNNNEDDYQAIIEEDEEEENKNITIAQADTSQLMSVIELMKENYEKNLNVIDKLYIDKINAEKKVKVLENKLDRTRLGLDSKKNHNNDDDNNDDDVPESREFGTLKPKAPISKRLERLQEKESRLSLQGKLLANGDIRGLWAMSDDAHKIPGETRDFEFKLVRRNDDDISFPISGTYHGWLKPAYDDVPEIKNFDTLKPIDETLKSAGSKSSSKIEHKEVMIDFSLEDNHWIIKGRGYNKFGHFALTGVLEEDGRLQMYREYVEKVSRPQSANATRASVDNGFKLNQTLPNRPRSSSAGPTRPVRSSMDSTVRKSSTDYGRRSSIDYSQNDTNDPPPYRVKGLSKSLQQDQQKYIEKQRLIEKREYLKQFDGHRTQKEIDANLARASLQGKAFTSMNIRSEQAHEKNKQKLEAKKKAKEKEEAQEKEKEEIEKEKFQKLIRNDTMTWAEMTAKDKMEKALRVEKRKLELSSKIQVQSAPGGDSTENLGDLLGNGNSSRRNSKKLEEGVAAKAAATFKAEDPSKVSERLERYQKGWLRKEEEDKKRKERAKNEVKLRTKAASNTGMDERTLRQQLRKEEKQKELKIKAVEENRIKLQKEKEKLEKLQNLPVPEASRKLTRAGKFIYSYN